MSGEATPLLPAGFTLDSPGAGTPPAATPPLPPGFKLDASTQAMMGAVGKGVKNQGRVTQDMLATNSGQHHAPVQRLERLPFIQQAVLASMDSKEERQAFLEQEHGKGSVTEDKHGLVVKGKDGKMYRGASGPMANLVSEAPETVLGIAGAAEGGAAGAIAGPAGAFVGAVGGAMTGAAAGKTIKEGAKAAGGVYRKTPGQYAQGVAGAAEAGAEGEMGARGVGTAVRRLSRGPLPRFLTGTTAESRAMTEKLINKEVRLDPAQYAPDARKLQRITILADKLTGVSSKTERVNAGYLQDRASALLNKAGVPKLAQSGIMKNLQGTDTAITTQQTGQMIQASAKSTLAAFKASMLKPTGNTAKAVNYLKQLSVDAKSPEDAYNMLVHAGQTDRLEKFIGVSGKNSPVVQAVQAQALKRVLAGAMTRTADGESEGVINKELKQFTVKQQKLLFPNGLDTDLKRLSQEIDAVYPGIKDPAMAGMTAGAIQQRNFVRRWKAQAQYAVGRALLQNPAIIRRLVIGFKGDSVQRKAARLGLREMFYFGAVEANEPQQQ